MDCNNPQVLLLCYTSIICTSPTRRLLQSTGCFLHDIRLSDSLHPSTDRPYISCSPNLPILRLHRWHVVVSRYNHLSELSALVQHTAVREHHPLPLASLPRIFRQTSMDPAAARTCRSLQAAAMDLPSNRSLQRCRCQVMGTCGSCCDAATRRLHSVQPLSACFQQRASSLHSTRENHGRVFSKL